MHISRVKRDIVAFGKFLSFRQDIYMIGMLLNRQFNFTSAEMILIYTVIIYTCHGTYYAQKSIGEYVKIVRNYNTKNKTEISLVA